MAFVKFCRIISHKGVCKNAPYIVQILQKVDGSGRAARGALDTSVTSKRKQREKQWMLKL